MLIVLGPTFYNKKRDNGPYIGLELKLRLSQGNQVGLTGWPTLEGYAGQNGLDQVNPLAL